MGPLSEGLSSTIQALAIDRVTAEVVEALERGGVDVLLLKGPGFVDLLYGDGGPRGYLDTDLLVAPAHEALAETALASLGFRPRDTPDTPVAANHQWTRGESMVELHVTLIGVNASPEQLWDAFATSPEHILVGGHRVAVPGRDAQLLHLALHAAQHGIKHAKTLEDLRRAVARFPPDRWTGAAALARRLAAEAAFSTGLRLTPDGQSLAQTLGLAEAPDRMTILRAASASDPALGVERLLARPTALGRLRWGARILVPTPAAMRRRSRVARRGRLGLALAYLLRPWSVAARAPGALREWRDSQ